MYSLTGAWLSCQSFYPVQVVVFTAYQFINSPSDIGSYRLMPDQVDNPIGATQP